MRRYEVRCAATIAAPVQTVWARVSDHAAIPSWVPGGPTYVKVTRPGHDAPGGLGAMREVKFPLWIPVTEEIVRYEPPHRYAYAIRSGMPHVGEHLGTVRLDALPDGQTALHWDIDFGFRPWHPFTLTAPAFVRAFTRTIQGGCDELARQLSA